MKYLKYFFILLLIPFLVLAEECDISKITVTSMEQKAIAGYTEVKGEPTFQDRNINLNLKMYEVGDSITYDMTIKNDSEENYMIDEDTFKTDSEYIEYSLQTVDGNNVVKAKGTKDVTLTVSYKKEVEESQFNNNKFDATNSLKLSLNTGEKEQPLDVITTDNIKEVKNPVTSISSMTLVFLIILITMMILYLLISRKNKYTKYLVIVLSMLLIPTVYAICKCDIEVESTIEIEKKSTLFNKIAGLSKEINSCVTKYEGEVTDEVNKTVNASNVYFDKCANQRNVIFGGFCWQVIRTTETKGTKLIYNGEPVDGKCESTRGDHKGMRVAWDDGNTIRVYGITNYSSDYTYDFSSNTFTLINPISNTWSDSTYKDLLGKYVCLSNETTCYQITYLTGLVENYNAYYTIYYLGDVHYSGIGYSPFNTVFTFFTDIGYITNDDAYKTKYKIGINETYKFANSFTYDSINNKYTLTGETITANDWQNYYDKIDNTHYTCWNTTGTCETISYVFRTSNYYDQASYIELKEGKSVSDAINETLSSDSQYSINSSVKGMVDNWYEQNMMPYTPKLEDTVFCNNRFINHLGGWNPNGGSTSTYDYLIYGYLRNSLRCNNISDQLSVSNNKAKLTYPVSLLQIEEINNIDNPLLLSTGNRWLTLSPNKEDLYDSEIYTIDEAGTITGNYPYDEVEIRPVISLKHNNFISSGTGSETDPWIIE